MLCPQCRHENPGYAFYCTTCGKMQHGRVWPLYLVLAFVVACAFVVMAR